MTKLTGEERHLLIDAPAGKIEVSLGGVLNPTLEDIAVVCHPHPLYGGTMDNKVVVTVAKVYRQAGIPTVRFNFRGVGKSTGTHAGGVGEQADLAAVLDWLVKAHAPRRLWLAGFSFGSYIAAAGAMRLPGTLELKQLLLVAPPVHHYPFADLALPEKICVVQGDQDEVVPPEEVFHWLETLPAAPQVLRFNACGHFFHGRLVELKERLMPLVVPA